MDLTLPNNEPGGVIDDHSDDDMEQLKGCMISGINAISGPWPPLGEFLIGQFEDGSWKGNPSLPGDWAALVVHNQDTGRTQFITVSLDKDAVDNSTNTGQDPKHRPDCEAFPWPDCILYGGKWVSPAGGPDWNPADGGKASVKELDPTHGTVRFVHDDAPWINGLQIRLEAGDARVLLVRKRAV